MPPKDPDSIVDYQCNWAEWLSIDEAIEHAEWIVPTGLNNVQISHSETVSTVWLSEGVVGETYLLTNRITTTGGRVEDRTLRIRVTDK